MTGILALAIACVVVFILAIAVGWIGSKLSDRLEQQEIRQEWDAITRVARPVPETGWGHVPVTDEEAVQAFIDYLAEKTDTWLASQGLPLSQPKAIAA